MGAGRPLREHHGAADATIRLSLRPDGQEGPEFDGISDGTLGLSPDGGRAIYAAKRGDKLHAVENGREGGEIDGMSQLVFTADGSRAAYAVQHGAFCALPR